VIGIGGKTILGGTYSGKIRIEGNKRKEDIKI
jgi:hypothetical protein